MQTAKLFQNGQSQAVRLPKEFRFEGNEVFIKRQGGAVGFQHEGITVVAVGLGKSAVNGDGLAAALEW